MLGSISLLSDWNRLGHAHDLQFGRILDRIIAVHVAARASAQRYGRDGFVGPEVPALVRKDERLAMLISRVRRPGKEGAADDNSQGPQRFSSIHGSS